MTDNDNRWMKITGIKVGDPVPEATFQTRVRDESIDGPNPYRWEETTMEDYTKGRRVVLFSLPGAFTPTCSTMQLPGFEENFDQFVDLGVDDIYCISVNDSFVMNAWAETTGAKAAGLTMLADPAATFTKSVGMNFTAEPVGFYERSKRYALYAEDGIVKVFHPEESRGTCEISGGEALLAAI